jgi:arginyl-tRNA synthetase
VCQILRRAVDEGLYPNVMAGSASVVLHDPPVRTADFVMSPGVSVLAETAELELALALTRFGDVVELVAAELTPHKLCGYLFELATKLSSFYEQCPVLKSEGEVRLSRLALCDATRRVLARGLELLGIVAPERM